MNSQNMQHKTLISSQTERHFCSIDLFLAYLFFSELPTSFDATALFRDSARCCVERLAQH